MSEETATTLIYISPLLVILFAYIRTYRKNHHVNSNIKNQAIEDGLTEPASLHPIVDPIKCIGCGSCIAACPEKEVLGLINNKAELIGPSQCIGHGACKVACPTGAIKLVFGTERRGIDLPELTPEFETNVPGVFIAGELGGMGLIRNAITQGKQAMEAIQARNRNRPGGKDILDVIIVGAGPAGFSATLYAIEQKMKYVTLEQDSLGGTVSHYPRGKLVMTAPADLPLHGKMRFKETTKEALMSFWTGVAKKHNVKINYQEGVIEISDKGNYFTIKSTQKTYKARSVLLAIGRRGTPRQLKIPGEDLPKVVYRLADPDEYRGKNVLVVGGGDSALEAAISIAELGDAKPILAYRSAAFTRAKKKNREKIDAAVRAGRLKLLLSANPKQIGTDFVDITLQDGATKRFKNDGVIICAGGILPTGFLKSIGISVITKYGTE